MLITNVDRVLEMLRARKELPVKAIAAALHADPKSIEKLAKLLEEEKRLTIAYRMFDPWLLAGFQEKGKKQKKPLFVWKKQQAAQPAPAPPPVARQAPGAEPPPPPQHQPLFTWKKQKQPVPASPLSAPPVPPQHKPLFTWKKQHDTQKPAEHPASHFSFPFLHKRNGQTAAKQEQGKQGQKPGSNFIRLTPQPEQPSINTDKEKGQELDAVITRAGDALKSRSYKEVYTAYNEGSALYKELQGADSRMRYFKKLSAVHDALLQELKR
ncbi:MAG TPA: hypothetical protein VJC16_01305 [Candidatus Nanoarchaeia archaeon]|nr:hypothetical protein [Candidatus Nanoarchaeia archaeon]